MIHDPFKGPIILIKPDFYRIWQLYKELFKTVLMLAKPFCELDVSCMIIGYLRTVVNYYLSGRIIMWIWISVFFLELTHTCTNTILTVTSKYGCYINP